MGTGIEFLASPGATRPLRRDSRTTETCSHARREDAMLDELSGVIERLDRIEAAVTALVDREMVREWYTTQELALKRAGGRGPYAAWVVYHEEVLRYRREGLRPVSTQ
jgi:hypothetical protein